MLCIFLWLLATMLIMQRVYARQSQPQPAADAQAEPAVPAVQPAVEHTPPIPATPMPVLPHAAPMLNWQAAAPPAAAAAEAAELPSPSRPLASDIERPASPSRIGASAAHQRGLAPFTGSPSESERSPRLAALILADGVEPRADSASLAKPSAEQKLADA